MNVTKINPKVITKDNILDFKDCLFKVNDHKEPLRFLTLSKGSNSIINNCNILLGLPNMKDAHTIEKMYSYERKNLSKEELDRFEKENFKFRVYFLKEIEYLINTNTIDDYECY